MDATGFWYNREEDNLDNMLIDDRDRGKLITREEKFLTHTLPKIDANSFDFDEIY